MTRAPLLAQPTETEPGSWLKEAFSTATGHYQSGRAEQARQVLTAILENEPSHSDSLHLMAVLAGQSGDLAKAETLLRQAIAIEPGNPRFHELLAGVLERGNRLEASVEAARSAIACDPGFAHAHCQLGRVLERLGRHGESAEAFARAFELNPDHAEARIGLARQYRRSGRLEEAAHLFAGLGDVHLNQGRYEDALLQFDQAIVAHPATPGHYAGKARALGALHRITEGLAACSQALRRSPSNTALHVERGFLLHRQGRIDDALEAFHHALDLDPGQSEARSAIRLCLLSKPGKRTYERTPAAGRAYPNPPDPERPLRLGYLTPPLDRGPLSFFLTPVLEAHTCDVVCYPATAALSAGELAARIEADRIDVLTDLGGHTRGNRLDALALRPAPVQLSWLGLPDLSEATCALIADPVLLPESGTQVTGCFLCYRAPSYAPDPAPPPCLDRGHITYGCFAALSKITPPVLELWARILQRDPKAHLMLKNPVLDDPPSRHLFESAFATLGIAADRIELWGPSPHAGLLAWYANVDIALDPFPFSSRTATCEALWMGVPVVTLYGDQPAGRLASSILLHAGLADWITHSEDDYVERALALGTDTEILRRIRMLLRDQISSSMIGDTRGFTRRLEHAYRNLWRAYCARATA